MVNSLEDRVSITENPELHKAKIFESVAERIKKEGYQTADINGIAREIPYHYPEHYILGILVPRESVKGFLGISRRVRGLHIGTLTLEGDKCKLFDKEWLLEIYGRDYVGDLKGMAERLAKEYDVNLPLRLETENPKLESYPSDFHSYGCDM